MPARYESQGPFSRNLQKVLQMAFGLGSKVIGLPDMGARPGECGPRPATASARTTSSSRDIFIVGPFTPMKARSFGRSGALTPTLSSTGAITVSVSSSTQPVLSVSQAPNLVKIVNSPAQPGAICSACIGFVSPSRVNRQPLEARLRTSESFRAMPQLRRLSLFRRDTIQVFRRRP